MKLELDIHTMQNQSSSHNSANENNSSEEAKKLLRAGINSAKEGNRGEARLMLLQVTEAEPQNETAWLWLASISEYPEELLVFLQNVLKINPENERAVEWAKQTKALLSKTFVQRGIDASHQAQKDFAKQCFLQAIVHDEQNEMAWLWLASSTDSVEEKCSHLQKVLNINPENETALSSMKSVKNQIALPYLKKASSAAISGDHELARQNLDEVMKYAPELEEAWVLKAFLASDFYEKIACYEKALQINPEHDGAKAGLASLQALAPKVEKPQETVAPVEEKIEVVEEIENVVEEQVESVFEEQQVEAKSENSIDEQQFEIVSDEPQFEETVAELDNILETPVAEIAESVQETTELLSEVFDAPTGELDEAYAQEVQETFAQNELVEEEEAAVEETVTEAVAEESQELASVQEFADEPQTEIETAEEPTSEVVEETQNLTPADESFETVATPDFQAENQAVAENVSVEEENAQAEEPSPVQEPQYFAQSQYFQEYESVEEDIHQTESHNVEEPQPEVAETVAYEPQQNSSNGFSYSQPDVYADHQQPTVEFSYQNVPAFTDPHADTVTAYVPQETVAPQSDYFVEEETQVVEQVAEEVQAEVVEENQAEVHQTFSTVEPIQCPFCQSQNEHQAVSCVSCQAMLSLSDLEMLLSHQTANQEVMLQSIEKMEVEKTIREFDVAELTNLGIAHLNAHNLRKGFTYLQEASQLNPNDVVLSSKVNFLAIRLSEIEEYDQKAQDNPVQSRTILVVDDSPTVRKLISGKLEKCGHSVVSAVDGMDALAKINEVIPDLVLLDITMPRLDGYQVCKLIRNNEITKDIPVVMISGKDGFFDKVRGRMAGSTGYITKPFGPDTLMKTIETYLA